MVSQVTQIFCVRGAVIYAKYSPLNLQSESRPPVKVLAQLYALHWVKKRKGEKDEASKIMHTERALGWQHNWSGAWMSNGDPTGFHSPKHAWPIPIIVINCLVLINANLDCIFRRVFPRLLKY